MSLERGWIDGLSTTLRLFLLSCYWHDSIVLPQNIGQLPLLSTKATLSYFFVYIAYPECQKLESEFHMNQRI